MCYTRRGRQISELMTSYIEPEYFASTGNYLFINFKTLIYTKINLFFPPQVNSSRALSNLLLSVKCNF